MPKKGKFLELITQEENREIFFSDGSYFDNLDEIYYAVEHNDKDFYGEGLFKLAKEVVKRYEKDKFIRATPKEKEMVIDSWIEFVDNALGLTEEEKKEMKRKLMTYGEVYWF